MNPGITDELLRVFTLIIPLIFGGVGHMVVVKTDILSYLKKPIHQRCFGLNKTWRGFFVMPLATWPGVVLAQWLVGIFDLNGLLISHSAWKLSLVLGTAYCLAELPNSWLKRRLGILEGQLPKKRKWFFLILDQADSALGCLLAYRLLFPLSLSTMVTAVSLGTMIHFLINWILFSLGLRKNKF